MPRQYARLAVDRELADEFHRGVKSLGRKPSEVLEHLLKAAVDAIEHGIDPIDMIHICRLARSLGLGRGGYEVGREAGILLRAYYRPEELLEILTRIGPKILHTNRVGPRAFRVSDPIARDTVRGILEGMGYRAAADEDIITIETA
ncbi:hypothetical protein [Thermoproteus tenax]|uniref:Uncharacterized protein n=1 Tax=Thermoproteus tenax (strain ATCC 35583 / DSM 2078 / JCM 9277 / NBRC 100435 / Kra 1) TaxID=768679 RepID=G4RJS9_THETK|nr:hypothetical protein [Thermoproteus tenax]CCC81824.1 conserved hypothetical protein [Thermoproteus tenax Kra 1]